MVPWPHIGRQPDTSMNSTPMSQSGRVGGYSIEPDMTSCPRGSNISARRTQSCRAMKSSRRADMLAPSSNGAPP